MKTLSIVCSTRRTVIDYYSAFTRYNIQYLCANEDPIDPNSLNLPGNVAFHNLGLRNAIHFDPIKLLASKTINLSWKYFDGLESHLANSDLIGLYDTYYFWNHQSLIVARKKQIPVFCEIWCNIPNHISSWLPPYSFITKEMINYASIFILRNETARNFTRSIGIPDEKTKVIYMGLDLDHFKPSTTAKQTDTINILYVGRLREEKGVLLLIKAFQSLHSTYPHIILTIAGSGPLANSVLSAAKSLPIKYCGFVSYSELPSLYQSADIFCSPSFALKILGLKIWEEYFSYTLMEAQACGLPIITTNTGGLREEIPAENLLIEAQNYEQLHRALEELILDTQKRLRLSKTNRHNAEQNFDRIKQAQAAEEILLSLAK